MNTFINNYLSPKKWEREGELYRKIGVLHFLKITPFELRKSFTGKRVNTLKSKGAIPSYLRGTILAELTHLFSFIFVTGVCIYFFLTEGQWIAIPIFLINILLNLYPVFLMRFNRFRISKALDKDLKILLREVK